MSNKKNVLFVISTLTGGGAERTVSTLSKFLSKEMNCSVLLNSVSNEDYEFVGEKLCLGMLPRVKKNIFYQIVAAGKRYIKLKELKKSGRYDVVISFMESANFLNILTGKYGTKRILSVRNVLTEEYTGFSKLILYVAKILYKKADYVVVLSEAALRDLTENVGVPKKKGITIYNGYDLTNIKEKTFGERTNFITMGRLVHQKGQWHLIRAFNKVVSKYPEATLKILGQGELEGQLKEIIDYYGIQDKVELLGFVNNPSDYLYKGDCFVFPSVYEGFGNALIEALMNGLPIIASDFTVAREVLAPEMNMSEKIKGISEGLYGIIVPASSPIIIDGKQELEESEEMLADAMIAFIEEKIGNNYGV